MNYKYIFNKTNTLLLITLILSLVVLFSMLFLSSSKKPTVLPTPSPKATAVSTMPTAVPVLENRPKIDQLPTLPPSQGGKVNIQASVLQESKSEVAKLKKHLPYEKELVLSNGLKTTVSIPSLQDSSYTLSVNIFGIDYLAENSNQTMKNAFKESVDHVYSWIQSKGADPNKIVISWGDRKFIRDKAELWLQTEQ